MKSLILALCFSASFKRVEQLKAFIHGMKEIIQDMKNHLVLTNAEIKTAECGESYSFLFEEIENTSRLLSICEVLVATSNKQLATTYIFTPQEI